MEAPASFPAPEEQVVEIELTTGKLVLLLAPEDVLMYRLHEFVATGHAEMAEQSVALLASDDVDYDRLIERADQERLRDALTELEQISLRLRRREAIPSYELHEIARRLRGEA